MFRYIKRVLGIERLEQQMSIQTDEIAAVKAEVVAYRDAVIAKVQDLEDKLTAAGTPSPELQTALDDLKATADSLTVPA